MISPFALWRFQRRQVPVCVAIVTGHTVTGRIVEVGLFSFTLVEATGDTHLLAHRFIVGVSYGPRLDNMFAASEANFVKLHAEQMAAQQDSDARLAAMFDGYDELLNGKGKEN